MRRRLAELLSSLASALLDAAHRLDPETVQIVETAEDQGEGEELAALAETREIAIGLAMLDMDPGGMVTVHNGGPGCTSDEGCGCGAVAYRADRGRA